MSPSFYGLVGVVMVLLALYAVLIYRRTRCVQLGHLWKRTADGYECVTCKAFVTHH